MRKSPEEYFKAQDFSMSPEKDAAFTPAERAFMAKYMGVDSARMLDALGIGQDAETGRVREAPAVVLEFCDPGHGTEGPGEQADDLAGYLSTPDVDVPPDDTALEAQPITHELTHTEHAGGIYQPEDSERAKPSEELLGNTAANGALAAPPTGAELDSPSTRKEGETPPPLSASTALDPPLQAEAQSAACVETGETEASANSPETERNAFQPADEHAISREAQELFGVTEAFEHDEGYLEEKLKTEQEIQMVGFFIGGQEFTIPTAAVQEVIRHMPVAKLPAAPNCVAGVINLRGRVTPLVELRDILEVRSPREAEDRFIIICRRQGLQIGMLIEKVHTMYRVPQSDIEWGIETHLGINAECVAGLFKQNEQLVSIVSVDRVIAEVLK